MKIHIVQKGDTLWNLSKKYNVGFDELKAANTQLANPELVMPGMKIKIPTSKKQVSKKQLKTMPEEKLITPFKQKTQKAQPVVKEDDAKPKKKVEKKMPFPKLPPISLQMPSLPSIHANQYNVDIDIDDHDTTVNNKHIETHHHPIKETKPIEKKPELPVSTKHKAPEQQALPLPPYGYMWMPMMPIYPAQQYCHPPMNPCQAYQYPSVFNNQQVPVHQAYYQPDNHQKAHGPKWGELDLTDATADDLTDKISKDTQKIENYYHQMNQAWSAPYLAYPYPTYNAANQPHYPTNSDHRNQISENEDK